MELLGTQCAPFSPPHSTPGQPPTCPALGTHHDVRGHALEREPTGISVGARGAVVCILG